MRKLWIFPLIFLLLLLGAGVFRWEQGPIQTQGDLQLVHTRDRWTGQSWITFFGGFEEEKANASFPYPLYSGERVPHLSAEVSKEKIEEVVARPENQAKVKAIEEKIREEERIRETNRERHDLYLEMLEKNSDSKRNTNMDEGLSAAYLAWKEAEEAIHEYTWQLNLLYTEFEKEMLEECRQDAKKREQIALIIWIVLLILLFIVAVHYFLDEVKREKRVNETYEIVEYVTKRNRVDLGN